MTVSLHVRDVPGELHETLVERAKHRGMSLRQYVVEVLAEHCRLPAVDEWLGELASLEPAKGKMSAIAALHESRDEDDRSVLGDHPDR